MPNPYADSGSAGSHTGDDARDLRHLDGEHLRLYCDTIVVAFTSTFSIDYNSSARSAPGNDEKDHCNPDSYMGGGVDVRLRRLCNAVTRA
jgi:hypothetical protein